MTIAQNSIPEKEAIRLAGFWQKFGPNTYPLDIEKLIDGAITNSGFSGELRTRRDRFENFEGSLVRTRGTQRWTILLNDNVANKRRQRFTYAHELGHFMCHRSMHEKFEDGEASLNNFAYKIEMEANTFAAWLLMPANILRDEFSDQTWSTDLLCAIGSRFECSLQAGARRFVELSTKATAFVVSRDGIILWSCKSKTAPYMSAHTFGNELPDNCITKSCKNIGKVTTFPEQSGLSWSSQQSCLESQYFDYSGKGYHYTCIEFTG